MDRYGHRLVIMALALVAVITVVPGDAFAAGPCTMQAARTPLARGLLFRDALEHFRAERPDLSAEQAQFLAEASRLGDEIAALRDDAAAQASFARKATRFMERSRELFTQSELGRLFTSMGPTQIWLAQLAAAVPYCNCQGSGGCTFGGGPTGKCQGGCVSWDDSGTGERWDGICNAAAAE